MSKPSRKLNSDFVVKKVRIWGNPKTLLFDFDNDKTKPFLPINEVLDRLGWSYRMEELIPTKHGVHCIVHLRRAITETEIIALQLLCGSDPKRELMNLKRVLSPGFTGKNRKNWNLLHVS